MISRAVEILRRGGLVAFPTETVYGLGADATNPAAVQRIFTAKGRPSTNPLIVHIASAQIARRYTTAWPTIAQQLADQFWPGPLTLVLPKSDLIATAVTAGRNSVGLRVPHHPLALELLHEFDGPVAAPSANRANHISPTQANHVRDELGDAVDLILDGGPCTVGIESTVLDLTTDRPCILRPGHVSRQQIQAIIGPVEVFTGSADVTAAAASPGQHHRHYSPRSAAYRFDRSQRDAVLKLPDTALILISPAQSSPGVTVMPDDPAEYARRIYQTLREIDALHPAAIYIEMPAEQPQWIPIRDRLMRATTSCIF